MIYSTLVKNDEIGEREIFVIYPASEKNVYALKNMKNYAVEFVEYPFDFEMSSVLINDSNKREVLK